MDLERLLELLHSVDFDEDNDWCPVCHRNAGDGLGLHTDECELAGTVKWLERMKAKGHKKVTTG